jgi:hypothetical protein
MIKHPQTPKRIFHQIADDPVRGEKLGGSRNILGRDLIVFLQTLENLVFLLGNIKLIQPADNFDTAIGG